MITSPPKMEGKSFYFFAEGFFLQKDLLDLSEGCGRVFKGHDENDCMQQY